MVKENCIGFETYVIRREKSARLVKKQVQKLQFQ